VTKPVILAVDDDREVLGAIERDLRQHYRQTYRIVSAQSSRQALEAAQEFKRRGTPIALFLVDQRMPDMTGTEFLREMRKLHPDAKRTLLTAYADSEAAIAAINQVGLDHYLMKPWDPPEIRLYPVLDDLRVIDLYCDAIQDEIPAADRKGHWAQEFYRMPEVLEYLDTQFGDAKRIRRICGEMQGP
jgi:CheY-like chemotaxis protein